MVFKTNNINVQCNFFLEVLLISYMFLFLRTTSRQHFRNSPALESSLLAKNIAGPSGIELPILFASIESIDTFVSIDDFDTITIVSPIPTN